MPIRIWNFVSKSSINLSFDLAIFQSICQSACLDVSVVSLICLFLASSLKVSEEVKAIIYKSHLIWKCENIKLNKFSLSLSLVGSLLNK